MSEVRTRLDRLSADQRLLLGLMRRGGPAGARPGPAEPEDRIRAVPPFSLLTESDRSKIPEGIEDAYPLTMVQSGMLSRMELREIGLAPPAYHNVNSWHVRAPCDGECLRAAVQRLIDRHPTLRASFDLTGYSEPLQLIHREVEAALEVVDLRDLDGQETERAVDRFLRLQNQTLLDLGHPPLLRFHVHLRTDDSFQFTLTEPHSLSDGWSTANNLVEIFRVYSALLAGEDPVLPPAPPVSYNWFVRMEREALASEETQAFWRDRVEDCVVTRLPRWPATLRPDAEAQEYKLYFTLDRRLVAGLRRFARRAEVPLKSVVYGAHLKAVSLVSGERDLLTGLVFNGRPEIPGGTEVRGLFLNTLPFRFVVGDESWIELIQRVFREETEILPHRRYPLAELQRRGGGDALPEIAFGYLNFHAVRPIAESAMVGIEPYPQGDRSVTHFPLMVVFELSPSDPTLMRVVMDYDVEEICEEQIRDLFELYVRVLEPLASVPERRHGASTLLPPGHRESLEALNDSGRWAGSGSSFPLLLARQTERAPGRLAMIDGARQLSYRELLRRTRRLARRLAELGVGPEIRVGVSVERGPELLVAVLAVLEAGGVFVPIDPALPEERLRYQLMDSGADLLVVRGGWTVPGGFQGTVLDVGAHAGPDGGDEPPGGAGAEIDPESAAYLIYTSGSTGRPKGVTVSHRALAGYLLWAASEYLEEGGRVPLHSSVAFDLAITSLLCPLVAGATIEVVPETPGGEALVDRLSNGPGFSMLKLTPTHLDLLRETLPPERAALACRTLVIGGEALYADSVAHWWGGDPPVRIVNEYGPTEATVGCTVQDVAGYPVDGGAVPIGKPIPGARTWIADSFLQPAPVATPGELCIGGGGLARGYHRRPALTAERFVPDPFSGVPGARLYRSGDRAVLRPDGPLVFLGRRDRQVKLRGHRVELEEIEAALCALPGVTDAAVDLREGRRGEPALAAFVVREPGSGLEETRLREELSRKLPEAMVPASYTFLEELPRSASGKLDRQALPAGTESSTAAPDAPGHRAPRTEEERILAEIWCEILGREEVGLDQNFFQLGGDSISALLSISKAKEAGLELTSRQLFQNPTLEALAAVAERAGWEEPGEGVAATGPAPLVPVQRWFFERAGHDPHHFNQAILLRLTGAESRDPAVLERVIHLLVRRHDALRSRFFREDGEWRQVVCPEPDGEASPRVFLRIDLSRLGGERRSTALQGAVAALHRSFDLAVGPLLRAAYVDLGADTEPRLFLVAHHLVVDGVSWRILLDDLRTAYRQTARGGAVSLPPKTAPFRQFALGVAELARSPALDADREFWLRPPPTPLAGIPRDFGTGLDDVWSGRTLSGRIEPEVARLLLSEAAPAWGASVDELLLSALIRSLAEWLGPGFLRIDLEGHGRDRLLEDLDVSRTVGWFTALHPLDLELRSDMEPGETVRVVRDALARFPHRGASYGVLRYLGEDGARAAFRDRPEAELSFNYFGQLDQVLDDRNELWIAPEPSGPSRARRGLRPHLIEVGVQVFGGALSTDWGYSANRHRRETIQHQVDRFLEEIRRLIVERPRAGDRPAEGPEARLARRDLDLALEEARFGE